MEPPPQRRLGLWLLLGIIVLPLVFYWFLLRKGYSPGLRIAGLVWLLVNLGFGFLQVMSRHL